MTDSGRHEPRKLGYQTLCIAALKPDRDLVPGASALAALDHADAEGWVTHAPSLCERISAFFRRPLVEVKIFSTEVLMVFIPSLDGRGLRGG